MQNRKKKYVISLDQGTTSSRAIIFDKNSNIHGVDSIPLTQIYPRPGWVEHNAEEILKSQIATMKKALKSSGLLPEDIACIGITNQRETVLLWDKETGKPLSNAIVWQCRRTAHLCDELKAQGLEGLFHKKTGLIMDAYFSGTKIKWLLDNIPNARKLAEQGKILAGTIDTWLIWNLTEEKCHVTDYSNASRTMLYNILDLQWDSELLKILDIPLSILPKVVPSSGVIGTLKEGVLGAKMPISGVAGDQQAALFGQNCFNAGDAKVTYGTGCFILMNTKKTPFFSKNKLLTTIAWNIGEGVDYALEGSVFNAGSTIQWLRDELHLIDSAPQIDIDAEKVPDNGGVYVVPAFTGLGTPYWDPYARGLIIGLTRGTTKEHLSRAVLESIAYQCADIFSIMVEDSGIDIQEIRVDGGASVSPFLMQFQADLLNTKINRPVIQETTALGAAYLAGIGIGFWEDKTVIMDNWRSDAVFEGKMDEVKRDRYYSYWKEAVLRAMNWERREIDTVVQENREGKK